ncbi:MAG: hypothetical protein OXF48_05970, partial [Bacteroidetes bacterium]|nr:hypothetical protein [Bacteroidota bacterium]
ISDLMRLLPKICHELLFAIIFIATGKLVPSVIATVMNPFPTFQSRNTPLPSFFLFLGGINCFYALGDTFSEVHEPCAPQ